MKCVIVTPSLLIHTILLYTQASTLPVFQASSNGEFAAPSAILVPPFMHNLAHLLTVVLQLTLKYILGPKHPTRTRLAYHLKAIADLKVVGSFNVTAKRLRDVIFMYVISLNLSVIFLVFKTVDIVNELFIFHHITLCIYIF